MFALPGRLSSLVVPWDAVIAQDAAEFSHTSFITEDEIDENLAYHGSGISGGKGRIYRFFTDKPAHTPKEKAEFLKNEYGTGGSSHAVSGDGWADHDAKGLRLRKGSCPDVTISWPNVVKRIDTLIHTNRYLTPEEQEQEKAVREARTELSDRYAAYLKIKESDAFIADSVLLVRTGDVYAAYGDDADRVAEQFGNTRLHFELKDLGLSEEATCVGVSDFKLDDCVEALRDEFDVTVVSGDSIKRYLSIDNEAKAAIDAHEAEFGADGWRAFGGHPAYKEPTAEPVPVPETSSAHAEPNNDAEAALDDFMAYVNGKLKESHDTPTQPSGADPRPLTAPGEENASRHDTSRQPETHPVREMTQEEIDDALQVWNGRIESKRAVVRYMEAHGRERETAAWLKNEFKSATPDLFDRVRLENGLTLINPDGSAETVLPWQKVQRRIAQLIREDRFYTEQELDNFEDIDVAAVREQITQKPEAGDGDRLAEMLRQAELASELYEQTGQSMFAFEEGNPQPVNLPEKTGADQPQPEYVSESVAEYPSAETGLPYDVSVQVLRTEPQPPIIVPPENFRITDDHLGEGGPKAKFRANMEAISTLKRIEAESRSATPEEQETLSRYVGWGGLADAFDAEKADWAKEYAELKEALTPEEYTAARASTLNAHYTSPTVIHAIYEALGNMGFTSGNILEPACGVGNFFGCLPQEMSASKLYGVELDSVSGRIAKQLYPQANITVAGFETTDRRGFYDVAIGNVPFGQYQVNDRAYNKLGFSIHN